LMQILLHSAKRFPRTVGSNKNLVAGFSIVAALLLLAAVADLVAPPERVYGIDLSRALKPPSSEHLFGTDHLGRDVFARVVQGLRIAFSVVAVVVLIESAVGTPLGLIAGYFGGKIERVVSAITDAVWALPPLVLALGIVVITGPSIMNVAAAIALTSWAPFTKAVQSKVKSIMANLYIEAARAAGAGALHIFIRYLIPSVAPTVLVLAAMTVPSAVMSAAALSFLGLGAQPPQPEWGLMISEGMSRLITAPWISTFPGIFIAIMTIGFNLLSDGLRDLLDPKLKTL